MICSPSATPSPVRSFPLSLSPCPQPLTFSPAGPAFSQLAFAISLLRGGILPALLSFVLLTGPGAGAMLGIGFAVKSLPAQLPPIVYALFSGLNSAAVGLVRLHPLF